MNDTHVVDSSIVQDIVLSAQEAITDLLTSLVSASNSESYALAKIEIQVQIENIGMMADMSGLKGLSSVCIQYEKQFLALPLYNNQDTQIIQEQIDTWLLDILTYLGNWQSIDNINQLITGLTANTDNIHTQLLQDIELQADNASEPCEVLSFPLDEDITALKSESINKAIDSDDVLDIDIDDFDAMFAEDEDDNIDLDSPEGIMALLCKELRELQPQITELTQQIVSAEDTVANAAIIAYEDIISRIHTVSDGLGLIGLMQVLDFVFKNINLLLELDPELRAESQRVIIGWPQVMIDHLESPLDDSLCLEVVDYLEDESWPKPLKYGEIRDLIDGLTKQLELTGDYEVEARSIEATLEDISLEISVDTSQQLLDAFFAESPGYAEELTMHISNITNGIDVSENTKAAQRISHTLKGSANLIGTNGIANLSHHLEDVFEYLAKQSLPPPEPLAYTMQEAADTIEVMIESLQGMSQAPTDSQRILQDLLNWANRIDKGHLTRETDSVVKQLSIDVHDGTGIDAIINTDLNINTEIRSIKQSDDSPHATTAAQTQTELLRIPRDTIDKVFNLIGETSISISQIQEQLKRMHERGNDMRKQEKTLQARRFELENLVSVRGMAAKQQRLRAVSGDDNFDSLEMDQYDEFYGATHSFIESVSDTREASRDVTSHILELEGLFLQQTRLNHALQDLVMTTRMVPVKTILPRLQRAVRQTCRATNKLASLDVIGEDLQMDGDVLNQLADPIMHLLRNAIDHGIELPQQRLEKGKPDSGQITLRFYQDGNSIKVNCSDDGAGLDYENIRWIAMERNLINPQEEINNKNLARVILSSGFSTRDKATHISGRGVGMDVVHTSVLNLKGSIEISDNQPSGTTISLRVPITLLTSHSILVKTAGERYAIPTSMLDQILPPGTGQFGTLGSDLTFQFGKSIYPTISLAQLLGVQAPVSSNTTNTVLLVHYNSKIHAVMVEHVVSNYDLVVKNLGRYVNKVLGIAGVSLLGDGGVVPVLDLGELLSAQKSGQVQIMRSRENTLAKVSHLTKILIVDDSLSVRKSLSQLIQDAGYEALLARDGIEAMEIMQKTKPNLILTDLEMPRMTGLELTSHIRANPDNDLLPIMMITSRTMAKHKEQAKKVGVNEYITKPFSEDDLISKIGEALNG